MGEYRKARMERRRFSSPPALEEKPVCTKKKECTGCPFPSSGFICWGKDGECMKTRIEKLREEHNEQNQNDKDGKTVEVSIMEKLQKDTGTEKESEETHGSASL